MPLKGSETARRWLSKASEDLRFAKFGLTANPPFLEAAAFHSQQAAEKALKSYLAYQGESIPRTHDLRKLSGRVLAHDKKLESVLQKAVRLTPYVIASRYPDAADEEFTLEKAQEAIQLAESVLLSIQTALRI